VNVTDNEGCVPLHVAAKTGYREIAELLLGSSNASLDARNRKQETPLGLSCSKGKPDMALFLIDHGSDTTRLLLDHDTDADRLDDSGCTPLHVASHEGHDEIIQLVKITAQTRITQTVKARHHYMLHRRGTTTTLSGYYSIMA
jgi:ankyrin repeat protein